MKTTAIYVFAGLLFATGLALAGMTRPEKVSAFLDVAGAWDASLLFVMGGAVGVYFVANRVARRATTAQLPIDTKLIAGAAIFGVGWGLAGFCPGPALVALGASVRAARWFVPAMVAGMLAHDLVRRARAPRDG